VFQATVPRTKVPGQRQRCLAKANTLPSGNTGSKTLGETLNDKTLARLLAPHPRVRVLRPGPPDPERKCVVYWMQRAQRGVDNPALNMTIALGNAVGQPMLAVFSLTADYPGGS